LHNGQVDAGDSWVVKSGSFYTSSIIAPNFKVRQFGRNFSVSYIPVSGSWIVKSGATMRTIIFLRKAAAFDRTESFKRVLIE
jgi:hypothetical protein